MLNETLFFFFFEFTMAWICHTLRFTEKRIFQKNITYVRLFGFLFYFGTFVFTFFELSTEIVLFWIVSHCMYIPQFVHFPVILSLWLFWIKVLLYSEKFSFVLGKYLGMELQVIDECVFYFKRNCQAVFQNGYATLHFYYQYVWVPVAAYPCQHLVL